MFFKPQYYRSGAPVALHQHCRVEGAQGYAAEVLEQLVKTYGREVGEIRRIVVRDRLPEGYPLSTTEEGYGLEIAGDTALLGGESERTRIYAAVTLKQLLAGNELNECVLYDAPDCPFRGYRVFLPGRAAMDDFKKMVDTIVDYKYNHISMEVGGAMEYKRHPEINEAWAAFVKETHRYSGRSKEIQDAYHWSKNSIHTDNAEGDILTQDEVREAVAYCRSRGLEVYPEVPTMSHSDYICLAHPELAERQEDPYPDAYCPNHPDTYPIVFDILEEIIDVFRPNWVNIGHDEMYSIGLCERCKGTDPHILYAQDIIKLHDWLAERGIRTMMWGEKLLPVITPEGKHYGGSGGRRLSSNGREYDPLPVLFYCQNLLPKDILMLNWYFPFGIQYDYVYHTHGYPVVYGNMNAASVEHWRQRRELGVRGGACSNWGSNKPLYMQRNNQYFNLIFGAYAMWSTEYDDPMLPAVKKATFEECFRLKHGSLHPKGHIFITHTTSLCIPFHSFYDGIFIEPEKYLLGHYEVEYTDGTTARLPVVYGENISYSGLKCDFGEGIDNSGFDDTVNLSENALNEVSCTTIPCVKEGKTFYTAAFANPHPDKKIASLSYAPVKDAEVITLSWSEE